MFLTPRGSHTGTLSIPNFNTTDKAYVASASSCTTGTCSVTVTLLPNNTTYYLRATTLYRDASNMTITGTLASGGAATFSGAQAVVDTTGQAQDVLRRIQVRVQLTATASPETIPEFGIASGGDICKRFSMDVTDSVDPSNVCSG
jgi:hypothetical protein